MAYTAEQLSDLECIRDVAKRYCRGVDRLDEDEMKSAYWPDATDDHGVFVGNAWEFAEHCMVSHQRFDATNHCIFNHLIELEDDGEHARGELYNVSYLYQQEAATLSTWHGRYLDHYEKRDEEWRILERVCVHEYTHEESVSPMEIDGSKFRQASFDRPAQGRPIGP
jgi:hypothetical protein